MNETISDAELRAALARSGYLLESRVDALFRSRKYHVTPNASIPDAITGKGRELDLHALNIFDFSPGELWLHLLVECVNNPQPLAMITRPVARTSLSYRDIRMTGLPMCVPSDNEAGYVDLREFLQLTSYHHVLKGREATQFCSFVQKRGGGAAAEWMALHEERDFDAFSKLHMALLHFEQTDLELLKTEELRTQEVGWNVLVPLVVIAGQLVEIRPSLGSGDRFAIRRVNQVKFRFSTFTAGYGAVERVIDVVTEEGLPDYLTTVSREWVRARRRLAVNLPHIRTGVAWTAEQIEERPPMATWVFGQRPS